MNQIFLPDPANYLKPEQQCLVAADSAEKST